MKIGLVLAGGGGKGAYQIGVWKALKEYGVDKNIEVVAGTSVGALNAALFMQGDFEIAENIWLNITQEKILTPDPDKLIKTFLKLGMSKVTGPIIAWLASIKDHGVFSRSGLLELIQENVDLNKVSDSLISGYGTCCHIPGFKYEYFKFNNTTPEHIKSVLLGSSAIPGVFSPEEIDGSLYIDGGMPFIGDNQPIKPVYDEGCDTIFVVHLSRESLINKDLYPKAQILEIVPQDHPGGLVSGTLNFTSSGSRRRIDQGYEDTIYILKPIFDMLNVQKKNIITAIQLQNDESYLKEKKKDLLIERADLKKKINELLGDRK